MFIYQRNSINASIVILLQVIYPESKNIFYEYTDNLKEIREFIKLILIMLLLALASPSIMVEPPNRI